MNEYAKAAKLRRILMVEELAVELSRDDTRKQSYETLFQASGVLMRELAEELGLSLFKIRNRTGQELYFINNESGRERASVLRGNLVAPQGMRWRCRICHKTSERRYGPADQAGWDESCILHSKLVALEDTRMEAAAKG